MIFFIKKFLLKNNYFRFYIEFELLCDMMHVRIYRNGSRYN